MPWLAWSVTSDELRRRLARAARSPTRESACPCVDGVMSTALSPSSDTDPSFATDAVVMRSRYVLVHLER